MRLGRYVLNDGSEVFVKGEGINEENGERYVIFERGIGLFVCSAAYWGKMGAELNASGIEKKSDRMSLSIGTERSSLNMYSSPEEKVRLFGRLFVGREDVYARRWESRDGRSGYSPVCLNEWKTGCLKPVGKCGACENKNYARFDDKVIENHLLGKITVGIYPLLKDESCRFVAVDFDDESWREDISAVFNLCKNKGIPAYMERSRSGNGGHLWVFFNENVPAVTARKLGSCILTAAMNEGSGLKLSSYDRLFPNQDTMPKGGFGNLIALSLQKQPRKFGNSVFVDDDFQPYSDQWEFLSNIKTVSKSEIEEFIKVLGGNEFGELFEDNAEKPWKKKKLSRLEKGDFPPKVNIVSANMIYIEKKGISPKGINALKRLAAFKNPEFYRAQAMRLSTHNIPRIIMTAEETEEYICLPRGLFDEAVRLFINNGSELNIRDETNSGQIINAEFKGELREEQQAAIQRMLNKNCGVLSAATAFGKTVVGAALIAARGVSTLVLVHRTSLLKQWMERLTDFLDINEELPVEHTPKGRKRKKKIIGELGGTKNSLNGIVDVAVMQSLIAKGEVKEIVKNYGMVIVDECHHVSAFTFEQILKNVNAKYVYGLTATPVRKDGHQPIIFMQCGEIVYRAEERNKFQIEHYMLPRFTGFRTQKEKIAEIYSSLAVDELRNEMIAGDCIKAVEAGRNPIILTERKAHVEILADKLKNYNVIKLVGGMGSKNYREALNKIHNADKNDKIIIISTGKLVGEGFDCPFLDTLFLAMPISWKGTIKQYAGRLHREYEGKKEAQIYDYIDGKVPILERMYQKRLKGYSEIDYKTKCEGNLAQSVNSIFDSKTFWEPFKNDALTAKSSIVIVSPFMTVRSVNRISEVLKNCLAAVTIITRPKNDYKNETEQSRIQKCIDKLVSEEITVVFKSMIHQKFVLIDSQIIWYGSINLLSFGASQESVMRLESTSLAEELLESVDEKSEMWVGNEG